MVTVSVLLNRIQSYLGNGGLFNPEMMDHDKVRDLIMDCQQCIKEHHETIAWIGSQDYERLLKRTEQFRKSLNLIAYSSHCIYPSESPSQYEVGKAHGHRCAANIARDALKD